MGTAKKAKTCRIYIGISTKICSRSAHIRPKKFSARHTAVVASNCGAPRAHYFTSRLTRTVLSGLDKTYRKTVTTFLETDMRGIMNFQMQLHLQAEIYLYLPSIFPKDMSRSQRPSYFDQFLATQTKPVSEMFSFLAKRPTKQLFSHF